MKVWSVVLVIAFIGAALVGCGGDSPAPADSGSQSSVPVATGEAAAPSASKGDAPASSEGDPPAVEVDSEGPGAYTSEVLEVGHDGALPVSMQLALGTLMLEDTDSAVTPEQAKGLLPLWQAIRGGSLQSQAETNAVLKQIESALVDEQLAAIVAMKLTGQGLGSWLQAQGMNFGPSPDALATRQAGGGRGFAGDMSEEERAEFRATMQAGGGGRGGQGPGGGFADMSDEERESMRATAEASGMGFGGRPGGGFGGGQLSFLAEPLVELLTQRAAE